MKDGSTKTHEGVFALLKSFINTRKKKKGALSCEGGGCSVSEHAAACAIGRARQGTARKPQC